MVCNTIVSHHSLNHGTGEGNFSTFTPQPRGKNQPERQQQSIMPVLQFTSAQFNRKMDFGCYLTNLPYNRLPVGCQMFSKNFPLLTNQNHCNVTRQIKSQVHTQQTLSLMQWITASHASMTFNGVVYHELVQELQNGIIDLVYVINPNSLSRKTEISRRSFSFFRLT